MRKLVLTHLVLILVLTLTTSVNASVELKATVSQGIDVTLSFRNMNSTVYGALRAELETNETKIPEIIRGNLARRNLTNAQYRWEPVEFNDAENSITVRFYLSGSDILDLTFSEEKMRRTYHVKTDWRKFKLNITKDLSLDFTEYFGKPISEWNFDNETYPTYHYNYADASSFDPACFFILPKEATKVHIGEDMETIIFELPLSFEESLLNSPFFILGAIIVVIIIASLYRTTGKRGEPKVES
jgi:hypothetical protein